MLIEAQTAEGPLRLFKGHRTVCVLILNWDGLNRPSQQREETYCSLTHRTSSEYNNSNTTWVVKNIKLCIRKNKKKTGGLHQIQVIEEHI